MVGSAIVRNLTSSGYKNIITRTSTELNLTNQQDVADFFTAEKPEYIFIAAAKVGGIQANTIYRADFIYLNLMIQNNVIHHSYLNGVKKLLFLGSSCIYPRLSPQPICEEYLMNGPLEYTNSPYAMAKIAGIEMCWAYNCQYGTNFISVMPTNLYGPNDNYDLLTSHVLPAMIRKFHLAKLAANGDSEAIYKDCEVNGATPKTTFKNLNLNSELKLKDVNLDTPKVELWGSGTPMREFLYVDDLAEACVFVMLQDHNAPGLRPLYNIGTGMDITIKDLSELIAKVVGYRGSVVWDRTKPDGMPRKLLDVTKINQLGWRAKTGLKDGIAKAYEDYKRSVKDN